MERTKFGYKHTCTCSVTTMRPSKDRQVIGADFKNKTKEGFKGYLWRVTKCDNCKKTVLIGESYADYRVIGEGLLLSAIQSCANDFNYATFNILTKQFYRGKHFQSKFIPKA